MELEGLDSEPDSDSSKPSAKNQQVPLQAQKTTKKKRKLVTE
jgi:hypothetical protein